MSIKYEGECDLTQEEKIRLEGIVHTAIASARDAGITLRALTVKIARDECQIIIFESGNWVIVCVHK